MPVQPKTDLSFKVAARDSSTITFDLEGDKHVYSFEPPKQALMVLPAINGGSDLAAAKAAFDWLDEGLSEEDQKHMRDRLMDKEDNLDIDSVEEVVGALVEYISGRPTT
jgi:hypothetical protein